MQKYVLNKVIQQTLWYVGHAESDYTTYTPRSLFLGPFMELCWRAPKTELYTCGLFSCVSWL